MTKDTCPLLLQTSRKISATRKGQKLPEKSKAALKAAAKARRHLNSWEQLKSNSGLYDRFESYGDFVNSLNTVYEKCWRIPLAIAKELGVTEAGVITTLKHTGKGFVKCQRVAKVYKNYGDRFYSYCDYCISVLFLHTKGYTPCQIGMQLGINPCGVSSLIVKVGLSPNRAKSGPSQFRFKEILIADALEAKSTTFTFENNPLPKCLVIKLREAIGHTENISHLGVD